jgi:hypothetical protein
VFQAPPHRTRQHHPLQFLALLHQVPGSAEPIYIQAMDSGNFAEFATKNQDAIAGALYGRFRMAIR